MDGWTDTGEEAGRRIGSELSSAERDMDGNQARQLARAGIEKKGRGRKDDGVVEGWDSTV
uniref:Uncharacterized protein n=1 Tax=Arundo donax TaxID=35708 RepID=A0A0A9BY02_ARUDO